MTMKRFSLPVFGMTCQSCASKIEKAVRGVPGVSRAMVDFRGQKALVEVDAEKSGAEELRAAVKSAGYSAGEPNAL